MVPLSPSVGVLIQNVNASWTEDGPLTLRNVSITVPRGKLLAIIGAVGAGKVNILHILLLAFVRIEIVLGQFSHAHDFVRLPF